MEFNNKLKPIQPKRKETGLELLAQNGVDLVEGENGQYLSVKNLLTGEEIATLTYDIKNLDFLVKAVEQDIDLSKALKQRAKQEKAAMPKQPQPKITETVTPLSYNEQGGVATENKPTSVKKVK